MAKVFPLEPRTVAKVQTAYRRIVTELPVPETLGLLQELRSIEPPCMDGQPAIVWDHADRFTVADKYGNQWIDLSSGVLITNAGHGRKEIIDAIIAQAQTGVLTTYCFPNEPRAKLVRKLAEVAPKPLDRVFLLSTGAEAVECAIKLSRTYGVSLGHPKKLVMVSFERGFHGRTLGAQQVGGIPELKAWIGNLDPGFVQVPFPDGFRTTDTSFELFEETLAAAGVSPENVAGVIMESYQGGGADFAPVEYVQKLRAWCDRHQAVMICDEVQAGFGRAGTWWSFEHYGIVPDLITCGKGISGSLPLSAVIGKSSLMNLYGPGSMTSTHTGNPVCCAAAIANIDLLQKENLVANAAKVGAAMHERLNAIQKKYASRIGACHGKGLVAGLLMTQPNSKDPDGDLAWNVVRLCVEKGVMLFAPVGYKGGCVKICPPLCITIDAMNEACDVIDAAIGEAIASS